MTPAEIGMALALGRPVHVACDYPLEPRSLRPLGSWAAHPLVKLHDSVRAALDAANQDNPA